MTEAKPTTPIRAIRAKCLDCTCGSPQEVRLCPTPDCPLYPYRMGHNPNRKGLGGKLPPNMGKNADTSEEIEEATESEYSGIDYEDS